MKICPYKAIAKVLRSYRDTCNDPDFRASITLNFKIAGWMPDGPNQFSIQYRSRRRVLRSSRKNAIAENQIIHDNHLTHIKYTFRFEHFSYEGMRDFLFSLMLLQLYLNNSSQFKPNILISCGLFIKRLKQYNVSINWLKEIPNSKYTVSQLSVGGYRE
jgi:hypothetical protein